MNISICPTGNIYNCKEAAMSMAKHSYSIEILNNLIKQKIIINNRNLKPQNGWSKSNEPEEHLDHVSRIIQNEEKKLKVLCFSYKDITLANRITQGNTAHTEILYDVVDGIANQYPEDSIVDQQEISKYLSGKEYDLIIIRHYLEHFKEFQMIINTMNEFLKPNGNIYIEVPDNSLLIERKIPLYLWEQHRVYFTSDSLKSSINEIGAFVSLLHITNDSIEPSICVLVPRYDNMTKQDKVKEFENKNKFEIKQLEEDKDQYNKSWQKFLSRQEAEIYMYGAGHNTDRFIQFTKGHDMIYRIIDDNKDKQGKYLAGMKSPIIGQDEIKEVKSPIIILGCHDRNVTYISKKLGITCNNPKIVNIFQIPQ